MNPEAVALDSTLKTDTPRLCHMGNHLTGETFCGTKVKPHVHTMEECNASHSQCVVCWSMASRA